MSLLRLWFALSCALIVSCAYALRRSGSNPCSTLFIGGLSYVNDYYNYSRVHVSTPSATLRFPKVRCYPGMFRGVNITACNLVDGSRPTLIADDDNSADSDVRLFCADDEDRGNPCPAGVTVDAVQNCGPIF